MSCSLVWVRKVDGKINGDLERILKDKFQTPFLLDASNVTYLEGLRDAGIKGVDALIEAIEKYDEITLELRC